MQKRYENTKKIVLWTNFDENVEVKRTKHKINTSTKRGRCKNEKLSYEIWDHLGRLFLIFYIICQ